MKLISTLLFCIVLVACLLYVLPSNAQDAATDASASDPRLQGVDELVGVFFKNWRAGEAEKNERLFNEPMIPVVRVTLKHHPKRDVAIQHGTAHDLMQEWQSKPPKHLVLEKIDSCQLLGEHMVVANTSYTGSGTKGRAVFVLHRDDENWKITSLVLETRFNW